MLQQAEGALSGRVSGYLHPGYAQSLAQFGTPRELPLSEGWILERAIPDSAFRDATGAYPIFACRDWSRIGQDLDALGTDLVSLVLVTDPFGAFEPGNLAETFDVFAPYKQHLVTDLTKPSSEFVSRRHRQNVDRALRRVDLETCPDPSDHLEEWLVLYAHLLSRHRITGIKAFSRTAFERQLAVPGLVMFRATSGNAVLGIHLWYVQGDVAYGHLGATNAQGYELMASYALYWYAIEQLRPIVRWLDLGNAPGLVEPDKSNGLLRFKSGWATDVRQVYLCGKILNQRRYAELAEISRTSPATFFPAYRSERLDRAAPASTLVG